MMRYVNRHAMTEVFVPLDLEQHASERARLLHEVEADFIDNLTRILERPGLWNGAMAGWHTVFVELPESTFNPVKTVFDLLRPAHQP